MSFNRAKILSKAQKLLQRGKIPDAIAEYKVLIEHDPSDVRTMLKIGDLHVKVGAVEDACQTYERVGKAYAKDGFFLKAVAVYKQLLKVDPSSVETYCRLAELYEQLGLKTEAIKQYQVAAKQYESQGLIKKSLDVLKSMSLLETDDFTSRIKLAELYLREGHKNDALVTLEEVKDELKEKKLYDQLSKVYEKMVALGLANEEEVYELVETYLDTKEPQKSLRVLQGLFQKSPRNIKVLDLLARCFSDLSQFEKSRSIYKEILSILDEQGKTDDKHLYEAKLRSIDIIQTDDNENSGPTTIDAGEHQDELSPKKVVNLSEIDTFLEYGLVDKAIQILSAAVLEFPERMDFQSKLESIGREFGLEKKTQPILAQVASVELSHNATSAPATAKAVDYSDSADATIVEDVASDSSYADMSSSFDLDFSDPELLESVSLASDTNSSEDVSHEFLANENENGSRDNADVSFSSDNEEVIFEGELSASGNPMSSDQTQDENELVVDAFDLDLVDDSERSDMNSNESFLSDDLAVSSNSEEASLNLDETSDHFEIKTDELPNNVIDFSLSTGELDRSMERSGDLVNRQVKASANPTSEPAGSNDIFGDQSQYDKPDQAIAAHESSASADFEDDLFDLSAELHDEIAAFQDDSEAKKTDEDFLSPEEVISEFKKGVSRTVSKDDHQTHYNLGIAYKEMGLLDEAISEFEIASGNLDLAVDCASMIGLCLFGKREFKAAISVYEKVLVRISPEHEAYEGIAYELAETYVGNGDVKKSYELFTKIHHKNPAFRDVKRRVKELSFEFGSRTSAANQIQSDDSDDEENENKVSFI